MEGFRRSSLKVSLMLTIFTWGWQAQAQGGGDLVFFGDGDIPGIFVAPADTFSFTPIPGLGDFAYVQDPIGIDYDPVDRMVYWTDRTRNNIRRVFLNGTGLEAVISEVPGPRRLSLDVQNRVMYWTSRDGLIEQANFDGQNRKVVHNFATDDLSTLWAVLVDPIHSHLYWTMISGGNARIHRSATDGSGSTLLVDTDLEYPSSLALDLEGGRLYWCDTTTVVSTDLLGQNRVVVDVEMAFGISIYAIGIYNGYIYFTSYPPSTIYRVSLTTTSVDDTWSRSFGRTYPHAFHIYKNFDNCDPNPCFNGATCTDGVNSFTCTCVAGFEGMDCATNTDDCSPNPCLNNGTCRDGVNGFTCSCVAGFTDSTCTTEKTSTVVPMPTTEPSQGELQTAASTAKPLIEATITEVSTERGPAVVVIVVCVVLVAVIAVALGLLIWYRRFRKHSRRHTAKPQPPGKPSHASDDNGQELTTYVNDVIPEDGQSHKPTSLVYEEIGGPSSCEVVNVGSSLVYEDVGLPSWAKPWSVPWDHFIVTTKVVHDGYFGEVLLGSVMINKEVNRAAIKILKTTDKENFMKDFETLTQLGSHPNVVSLLGACQYREALYVALEYLPVGNLRSYLRNARSMELESQIALVSKRLIQFALDVTKGMHHLATSGVIHRDLAARNIFLSDDLVAKVSNFGLSREEDIYVQKSKARVPTRWLSLESLLSKTYSSMSDVWSFGILLWEIATLGGTPYEGINSKDLRSRLKNGYRMPKPSNCDDQIYDLMQQCWQKDPKDRPPFKKLVSVLATMANNDETYMWLLPEAENYMYLIIRPEMDDN